MNQENNDNKLSEINAKNKEIRKLKMENFKFSSKSRLIKILEKKMKTSFIGAISAIEENLGYLWGWNKKQENLTEQEKRFKLIWETIRNKILNNGNSQIRAVYNELEEYDVIWNMHNYNFKVKGKQE